MHKPISKAPLFRWTIAFCYLALLSVLLLTPDPWWHLGGNSTPVKRLVERSVSDYTLHGFAFMVLAILFHFAQCSRKRPAAAICLVILAAYAVILELLQTLIPARTCHVGDMLANLAGLTFGWLLLSAVLRVCAPSRTASPELPVD